MDSLYHDTLLAYAKNTTHERGLPDATHRASDVNTLCGDSVKFEFIVKNKQIIYLGHKAIGCVLCRASTAWLADKINSLAKVDAINFIETLISSIGTTGSPDHIFFSAIQNPTRTKCITLPWYVARHALTQDSSVVIEILRTIYDPELPINIYDLGLIYDIAFTDDGLNITMTLTSPNCPVAETFPTQIQRTVSERFGITTNVIVTFDPPWTIERATSDARIFLQR